MHISELPYEIISAILTYSLDGDPHSIDAPSQTPLCLSNVCSTWREISLQESHLWSHIVAKYSNADGAFKSITSYIDMHLERAGSSVPIDLTISSPHETSNVYLHADTISPLRDRLNRLCAKIPVANMHAFHVLEESRWLSLQELCLHAVGETMSAHNIPPTWPLESLKAFRNSSRLHTLILSSEREPPPPTATRVPRKRAQSLHFNPFSPNIPSLSNLRHLHFNRVHISLLLLVEKLKDCPQLESLTISFGFTFQSLEDPLIALTAHKAYLPNLQSLRVIVVEGPAMDFHDLSLRLNVPALKELIVTTRASYEHSMMLGTHSSFRLQNMLDLLNTSDCQLESLALEVQMVEDTTGAFIRQLRRNRVFQKLKSLRLCATGIEGANILSFLTRKRIVSSAPAAQARLMDLKKISIGMYYISREKVDMAAKLAADMVESRKETLEAATFGTMARFPHSEVERLRAVQEERGIPIRLVVNEGTTSYL
jgi:hypothetical protein